MLKLNKSKKDSKNTELGEPRRKLFLTLKMQLTFCLHEPLQKKSLSRKKSHKLYQQFKTRVDWFRLIKTDIF